MGKKILLADDSITIQKVIELTFSDEDFEVVTVGNGRLAVEKVQDIRPDLVLCDIIMPEKDGYEVCDFIKKTPSLAHIPVLLLTGAFEPFDQDRASRVGCDGFLAKPFEPQTLIAKVKDLLSQAGTRTVAPTRPAAAASAPAPAPVAAPPPPAPVAPPVMDRMASREAPPSFIADEPLEETPTMITPSYTEIGKSVYEEPPIPPPSTAAASSDELSYVEDLPEPDELMDVSPEESATLQGDSGPEAEDESASPWAQPTVEVPLETRAQASVESAQAASEATFDEVFEEEAHAAAAPAPEHSHTHAEESPDAHLGSGSGDFGYVRTPDVIGSPAAPSVPSAAAPETVREGYGWVRPADLPGTPPARHDAGSSMGTSHREMEAEPPAPPKRTPEAEKRAPEPMEVAAPPVESSFSSVAPQVAPEPPPAASAAAEVGVPVDMVEKIAQRVVAQISEKVIREIAWEVIPDLAENLIKKEIDKLKAELQQT
jgi:CheY-like chemotaxis protein